MTVVALSVIIPVGPGDQAWHGLLPQLAGLPESTELIISACEPVPDEESTRLDSVCHACHWLQSRPGRAYQLNRGIEFGQGRMLWLLHADSRPTPDVIQQVCQWVDQHKEGWLYFDLAFDDRLWGRMQLNTIGARLRSRLFDLPFGDQGWLISRQRFEHVGPFDASWHRGEDLEWAMRARRHQLKPVPSQTRLVTSSRRYREQGWFKTTLNHVVQTLKMVRKARQQKEQNQ